MRRRLACLMVCGLVWIVPRAADACSCMGPNPPCSAVWRSEAVFVAQVVGVEQAQMQRRVHLQVLESFRGPSSIVTVVTGSGGGDCGYAFQPGETYLIYAHGNKATGVYSTGICSRTRLIGQAAEDLEYLRTTARTPSNLGLLRGVVSRTDPVYEGRSESRGVPDIRVRVAGRDASRETLTDEHGRYELQLPPGEYEVSVDAPEGLYASIIFRRVELRDARGCAEANVALLSDGRIRGRVVDARGQPVPDLPLELLRLARYGFTALSSRVLTRTDGTYEFTRIGPGEVYVAVDTLRQDPARRGQTQRVFLPGTFDSAAATAVTLEPTERVRVADFVLPDASGFVRLSGQMRTPDGQPIAGARIYVRIAPPTSQFFFGPPVETDANGTFTLLVPGEPTYQVAAEFPDGRQLVPRPGPTIRPSQGERWVDLVIPAVPRIPAGRP